jgi:hypothetical protein
LFHLSLLYSDRTKRVVKIIFFELTARLRPLVSDTLTYPSNMDSTTIDLDRAERAVSSILTNDVQCEKYQTKTLQGYNNPRRVHLPLFPTIAIGPDNCLLLANVPGS